MQEFNVDADGPDAPQVPEPASFVPVGLGPFDAVELADQLLTARTDLERLHALLENAAGNLMVAFLAAEQSLAELPETAPVGAFDARRSVRQALTALQFPDMAAQILTHVDGRIRAVTDRLGSLGGDEPTIALVDRACPVAQREMDAGSVELF